MPQYDFDVVTGDSVPEQAEASQPQAEPAEAPGLDPAIAEPERAGHA